MAKRYRMVHPIRPDEIAAAKKKSLPEYVIRAINALIVKNWTGSQSKFKQEELIQEIMKHMQVIPSDVEKRKIIFDSKHLEFEDAYRSEGWKVSYDRPGYCETYEANWTFTRT